MELYIIVFGGGRNGYEECAILFYGEYYDNGRRKAIGSIVTLWENHKEVTLQQFESNWKNAEDLINRSHWYPCSPKEEE